MQRSLLKNYAKLLAHTGLNVQKGQDVILSAAPEISDFALLCAEECYRLGARTVRAEWSHQPLARLAAQYCDEGVLGEVPAWQEEKMRGEVRGLPARLYLESEDPDGMRGVDAEKYARALQRRRSILKPYRDKMENKYQWCIAAVPGTDWARKVFPAAIPSMAVEKLWNAILSASRALEGNPVSNWQAHDKSLQARCAYLNGLGLTSLEYRSSNGTDLRVGLMREGMFAAGSERTLSGVRFNPNIPSEECYTTPKRGEAEGVVYSTKPLSYSGRLVSGFCIRFGQGRAVSVRAAAGEEVLRRITEMDEGASYLGEAALVPFDSPINRTGLLFYNTLFDENACCHLALGRGFTNCVRGFEEQTDEQLHALGVNDSMVHVDFMIGSEDLEIDGVTDTGARHPLFRGGNWAFRVD